MLCQLKVGEEFAVSETAVVAHGGMLPERKGKYRIRGETYKTGGGLPKSPPVVRGFLLILKHTLTLRQRLVGLKQINT